MDSTKNNKILTKTINEIQSYYSKIENELDKMSSHKHEPRQLTIIKLSGNNNKKVRFTGKCEGIEIGKCVYLYGGVGGEWFITTQVEAIDIDNCTFTTKNSVYKYEYL